MAIASQSPWSSQPVLCYSRVSYDYIGEGLYQYSAYYQRSRGKPTISGLTTICAKEVVFFTTGRQVDATSVFDGNGEFTAFNGQKIISTHSLDAATTEVTGDYFGNITTVPNWADLGTTTGYGTYVPSPTPPYILPPAGFPFYALIKYDFQYQ